MYSEIRFVITRGKVWWEGELDKGSQKAQTPVIR